MLGDSININNFNWNLVVLKKNLLRPLKITIFWPHLRKKGLTVNHAQNKILFFFSEITEPDLKLLKTSYFIKISYVLAEL